MEVTPNSLILEIEKGETQKEEGERGDEEMLGNKKKSPTQQTATTHSI